MKEENTSKKAYIIYERYYDFDNHCLLLGGVQTYITNLIPLLIKSGYIPCIYQCGIKEEKIKLNNFNVYGVPKSREGNKFLVSVLLKSVNKTFDIDNDLLIFADHILTSPNNAKYSLSIQHGIHWDISKDQTRSNLKMFLSKMRFAYNEHKRMSYVKHVVCVDYNFLNWYRTQVDMPKSNFTVIPNFTKIAEPNIKPTGPIKIIFARRFFIHRGTRVFAEAVDKLLNEYNNIQITLAGKGPDEPYLHDKLDKWGDKVLFTQYSSEDVLSIHADKNIAVVPTTGSEGTSLSLLEAMSAQCAVICTNVGGLTNIVIDGYNGLMVNAGSVDELYKAMKELIDDKNKRDTLALNGYNTVKCAFSKELWSKRWMKILQQVKNESEGN